MVPQGAILTYSGKWPAPHCVLRLPFPLVSSYVGQVAAKLGASGIVVRDSRFSSNTLGTFSSDGVSVTLTVQVQNGLGFANTDDVVSIIRHAVYETFCAFPLSDSVPFQQNPGEPQSGTGQPQPSGPNVKACAGSLNAQGNWDLQCWLQSLTQQGMFLIGFVGIVVLVLGTFLIDRGTVRVATR